MKNFGKRLKEVFDNRQNSDIAKLLKVSDATITNYMNGRVPSAKKLVEISKLTKCNLHWLLTGQGKVYLESDTTIPSKRIAVLSQKGGAGATVTAIFLSAMLADRGFRVLFVGDDKSEGIITFSHEPFNKSLSNLRHLVKSESDYYFPSQITGLDIFISKGQSYFPYIKEHLRSFKKNFDKIANDYDFIVIDVGDTVRFAELLQNKYLNDLFYLHDSNVLLSYQLYNSRVDNLEEVLDFLESKKLSGSNIEFIGTFINNFLETHKKLKPQEKIDEIKQIPNTKLLNTIIRNDDLTLDRFISNPVIETLKKGLIYEDYSKLTDEVLEILKNSD